MARNGTLDAPRNRTLINKLMQNVQGSIAGMYTKSYYNRPTNLADIKDIKDRLNNSINTITSRNLDTIGEPNISKLLNRAQKAMVGDKSFNKSIEDFFSDSASMDALLQTYMENKYLVDLDQEIDVICKYMPKLLEALDTKKDNVLSADHFAKDFIFLANSTSVEDSIFSERIKNMKDKYELLTNVETWYNNASKYGEQFLYIVPFKRAIGQLLDNKKDSGMFGNSTVVGRVTESAYTVSYENGMFNKATSEGNNTSSVCVNVELDTGGMLREVVEAKYKACKQMEALKYKSLCEQQMSLIESAIKRKQGEAEHKEGEPLVQKTISDKPPRVKIQNTIDPDELDLKEFQPDTTSQDGLITGNKEDKESSNKNEDNLTVPGCIVKKLKREMVKPMYIEDVCIGYLYLEVKEGTTFKFNNSIFDRTSSDILGKDLSKDIKNDTEVDKRISDLSMQVSKFINAKFVNSNIDLSKEIYALLKHNDYITNPNKNIKVTFLPADDVVHIKFNEDPNTHRGISDLTRALFPAKIYCAMYLVNAIANMTRGYDRRVYYVKQTVDTNIAKTLLNTINQLKKSNFNIRQIENINNIIGISGSLHDYLIPTLGGEPPIQFEIMPGQRIDPPTEQLQALEEMAINSTDVPLELIQARQSMDYAVHYTMTNSKFLRKIYNRQSSYAKFLSIIFTKIYNYEYNTNEKLVVTLPPPMFLNITNTNQVIQNTMEFANNITNIYMADEPNESVKARFLTKVQKYYLGSYLDMDILDKLRNEAEQEITIKASEQQ